MPWHKPGRVTDRTFWSSAYLSEVVVGARTVERELLGAVEIDQDCVVRSAVRPAFAVVLPESSRNTPGVQLHGFVVPGIDGCSRGGGRGGTHRQTGIDLLREQAG